MSKPTPDREPSLDEIEAVVKTVSRPRARGADVRRMQAMAAEWLAYLCTRVREAEEQATTWAILHDAAAEEVVAAEARCREAEKERDYQMRLVQRQTQRALAAEAKLKEK